METLKKIKTKQRKKNANKPANSKEVISLLKECRDLLVMCTLIDKSGQCELLVSKVDIKMGWN